MPYNDDLRLADVICQHRRDGTIVPIKIRLRDGDGEFQIYMIQGYKDLSHNKERQLPNGVAVTNHIWQYECQITVLGMPKIINLFYNTVDNRWRFTLK